jgi:hypothetical protein
MSDPENSKLSCGSSEIRSSIRVAMTRISAGVSATA